MLYSFVHVLVLKQGLQFLWIGWMLAEVGTRVWTILVSRQFDAARSFIRSLIENSSECSDGKGYSFGDNYFINKRNPALLNECRKPRWQTQNDLTKCQYITVKNGFCLNGINARWHIKWIQTSIDRNESINLSHLRLHFFTQNNRKGKSICSSEYGDKRHASGARWLSMEKFAQRTQCHRFKI